MIWSLFSILLIFFLSLYIFGQFPVPWHKAICNGGPFYSIMWTMFSFIYKCFMIHKWLHAYLRDKAGSPARPPACLLGRLELLLLFSSLDRNHDNLILCLMLTIISKFDHEHWCWTKAISSSSPSGLAATFLFNRSRGGKKLQQTPDLIWIIHCTFGRDSWKTEKMLINSVSYTHLTLPTTPYV